MLSKQERPNLIQKSDTLIEPYRYDTVLKNGYKILFKVDKTQQYLFLSGSDINKEISSESIGLPYKSLGYIIADFDNYFVLAHSFGSGNPTYIELIKKQDGKNVITEGSVWIAANEDLGLLLYSITPTPSKMDKMTLLDVEGRKKINFSFPYQIFGESSVLDRIKVDSFTNNYLSIEYLKEGKVLKQGYKW